MPSSTESVQFSNIAATTAAFRLKGGKYAVAASATGSGTMGLQMLSPDGVTFIAVHTAFAAVTGFANVDLPAGQYKFVIAAFTAVYASISSVPS